MRRAFITVSATILPALIAQSAFASGPSDGGAAVYQILQFEPESGSFEVLGEVLPFETRLNIDFFYQYGFPIPRQANFPADYAPPSVDNQSQLFLIDSEVDGLSIAFVHDQSVAEGGAYGGSALTEWRIKGDPDGAAWLAQDEPLAPAAADAYSGEPGEYRFTASHFWDEDSDGAVLGSIDGDDAFVEVQFIEYPVGLESWVAYSAAGLQVKMILDPDRPIRIERAPAQRPADLDGNGAVDAQDLVELLGGWGVCDNCEYCPADLDGDCGVGVADLLEMLGDWG